MPQMSSVRIFASRAVCSSSIHARTHSCSHRLPFLPSITACNCNVACGWCTCIFRTSFRSDRSGDKDRHIARWLADCGPVNSIALSLLHRVDQHRPAKILDAVAILAPEEPYRWLQRVSRPTFGCNSSCPFSRDPLQMGNVTFNTSLERTS